MLVGPAYSTPPSIFKEFTFDTLISEVSFETTFYIVGIWEQSTIEVLVNGE